MNFTTELDDSLTEEDDAAIKKTELDKNDLMNDSGIDSSGGEEDKEEGTKDGETVSCTPPFSSPTFRYKLRQEPFVDLTGQSLTPANINGRHRSLTSSLGYNGISYQPWR